MAITEKQLLPFHTNQLNRKVEGTRQPDTISLALSLQTTLDIGTQLNILFTEINHYLAIDGASYTHQDLKINYRIKDVARHSCSYNLQLKESSLGTLEFSRSTRFFEEDLEIIEYLLSATLYPLNNAIEYHNALKLAHRDPLTGIANRMSMSKTLQREVNRAQRYELPLSLLVIDLDHFKKINDQYGHSTGDLVLKEAVSCIERGLRLSDQAFRFGGEEFVVLLSDTNIESAQVVAERIRSCIASSSVISNESEIRFSTSIGVAELGKLDTDTSLFDHADNALYLAKSEGRNCVAIWKESYGD